jgi:exodeoxyribonuclease V alpha subunit
MKLDDVRAAGWVRDLDVELVRRLEELSGRDGGGGENVRILLALASAATDGGDVCLPLEPSALEAMLRRRAEEEGLEDVEEVLRAAVSGVAKLGECALAGEASAGRPFVVEGGASGRLYVRRYWRYEEETAAALLKLAADAVVDGGAELEAEAEGADLREEQRAALRGALEGRLTVITGGPGTGKTFVAAHLLKILMKRDGTKVVAAAPTGKAAARLKESLAKSMGPAEAVEVEAKTVDRLLGWQEGPYFKHDANNPLRENVVVVDETSMLDLPKAAKLLRAMGDRTRLVLLGDEHQLSSVAPGNVLAEICASTRLAGRVKRLEESVRFKAGSDVQILASAVLAGAKEEAWTRLTGGKDVQWRDAAGLDVEKNRAFGARLAEGYRAFTEAVGAWKAASAAERDGKVEEVLKALGTYRVLCVTRHGPQGTEAANRAAAARLFPERGKADNYDGRVVMILKNNPAIGLYNGDVGVVLGEKAWFPADGKAKDVPVFLLPEHGTAFAMTVHKSQGSEFDSVTVLLPEKGCEALLRRELLYTAITRTKSRVDVWCTQAAFAAAVATPTGRNTGLRAKLDRIPQ